MKSGRSRMTLFVLLILALIMLVGCVGGGKVYVLTITVLGEGDLPLEGASVVSGKETKNTDADGKAVFYRSWGITKVEVTADGYQAESMLITVIKDRTGTIKLTPSR